MGVYSIRAKVSSVDGMSSNSKNFQVEVSNRNPNEIEIFGFDPNQVSDFPSFALSSEVEVAFNVSSKLGQLKRILVFDDNVEIGVFDPGNDLIQNITFNESTQNYYVTWAPTYEGQHSIFISAEFDDGTSVFSNPFAIDIVEGQAGGKLPMVDLLSPVSETSLTLASTIRLEANATDSDGFIEKVEFYVNGDSVASANYDASYAQSAHPYGYTWSPETGGVHFIHAVAVDNSGNRVMSGISEINVIPGTSAPNIDFDFSIIAEDGGFPPELVPSSLDLDSVMVGNGDNGVFDGTEDHSHITYQTYLLARTAFTNDKEGFTSMVGNWDADSGEYVGAGDSAGFNYWARSGLPARTLLDALYNAEILTNENHPVYKYIFNKAKYSIGDTVFFSVGIDDLASTGSAGVVEEVQFFVNGRLEDSLSSAPYEFSWTSEETGKYEAYVVAHDNEGNQVVSAIKQISVNPLNAGTIDLFYPRADLTYEFAPLSPIPVIANIDYDKAIDRVAVFVNNQYAGDMNVFGGGNNAAFRSNRFYYQIQDLEGDDYTLRLVAYDESNDAVASSTSSFSVSSYEGSLPPVIRLAIPDDFSAVTSTSVIPLSARASDPDGAVVKTIYFVDGVENKSINRIKGINEVDLAYATMLEVGSIALGESEGFRSIFAIALDNSGNSVASEIFNFSFTQGDEPPVVNIVSGLVGFEVTSSQADFDVFDSNGSIKEVVIQGDGLGHSLLDAKIEISGTGEGAEILPVIDKDATSGTYGKIISFDLVDGGFGYDKSSTILHVVPILRTINSGTEAKLEYSYNPPTDLNQTNRVDLITVATVMRSTRFV